jgi:hypothetical protein
VFLSFLTVLHVLSIVPRPSYVPTYCLTAIALSLFHTLTSYSCLQSFTYFLLSIPIYLLSSFLRTCYFPLYPRPIPVVHTCLLSYHFRSPSNLLAYNPFLSSFLSYMSISLYPVLAVAYLHVLTVMPISAIAHSPYQFRLLTCL